MDVRFESSSLTDPALYDDPWAFYAWLRAEHPVWFDASTGLHAVSRHADVVAVSRDPEHFSAAHGVRPISAVPLSLLTMDDPDHARQRRLLARGFTPKQVRTLTEHVRELTNQVIDSVAASGEIDFVADLATHVPMIVISELLGLDPALGENLSEWSEAMIAGEGAFATDGATVERAANAFMAYTSLVSDLVEERRTSPRDDMLSILTAAYDRGELAYDDALVAQYDRDDVAELSNDELLMFCVLLMVGGNETTRNAIAGGLRAFSQFPAQRELLIRRPELITSAVEEILRWTTPVLNFTRTVTSPVTVAGVDLAPGDRVMLLYQSANRDEAAFDAPDEFRVDRVPNPHVAFGFGPHYCMGASLARMEIEVVYGELFRRLPDITAIDPHAAPAKAPSAFIAGIRHLPARFTPVQPTT
jgi:cytochrome P450 family 142 subfamily A polypeptide 1